MIVQVFGGGTSENVKGTACWLQYALRVVGLVRRDISVERRGRLG